MQNMFLTCTRNIANSYTRIIKLGIRPGDNAEKAMIELVDFNEVYTKGTVKTAETTKKTRRSGGAKKKATEETTETTTEEVTKREE